MKYLSIFVAFVLSSFIVGAEPVPPKTFHYMVRIAATTNTCAAEAHALATRFSVATGLQVTKAQCNEVIQMSDHEQKYSVYSLLLTYLANNEARPYSALFGDADLLENRPTDTHGAYATYADCTKDLPAQSSLFQQETRLVPVAASCQIGQFDSLFVLRIDGFGKPKNSLYTYRPGINFQDRLLPSVQSLITQLGGRITLMRPRVFFYYSEDPLHLRDVNFGIFGAASECKAQIPDAVAAFKSSGSTVTFAICSPGSVPGAASLNVLGDGAETLFGDGGYSSAPYYSFESCMQDKARVLQDVATRNRGTSGGICHTDFNRPGIYIIETFWHM